MSGGCWWADVALAVAIVAAAWNLAMARRARSMERRVAWQADVIVRQALEIGAFQTALREGREYPP